MKTFSVWLVRRAKTFSASECGAVTVDWVVLTAAICGMTLGVFTIIKASVYEDAASGINERLIEASTVYR